MVQLYKLELVFHHVSSPVWINIFQAKVKHSEAKQ